jgi:hypothetical protein
MKILNGTKFLVLLLLFMGGTSGGSAQGTLTFDGQPLWSGTSYSESGMTFQLIVPQGSTHDDMVIIPANFANNVPQSSTPFMAWFNQNNPSDYISLSLTDSSLFGLSSVQLADPNSPSASPVAISFIGYLAGGSTVTETFTTPGNGSTTFANFTFSSDFSSRLTHVDILAPKWAMDNLVFTVPEPSSVTLALLGLCLGFGLRRRKN